MSIATSLGISLVLQAGVRDTVVMIPASRGLIETVAMTGQFLVSILVLILLGGLLLQLVALRKAALEVTRILQTSSGDINAAAQSVRKVVDDVRGITQTVKTEVGAVSNTVRYVHKGVRRVVRRAEARLDRLDALVGVAQEEAEEFVMSSASALRGVRLGAAALKRSFLYTRRRGVKRKKRRPVREERTRADNVRERPRIRTKVVDPA